MCPTPAFRTPSCHRRRTWWTGVNETKPRGRTKIVLHKTIESGMCCTLLRPVVARLMAARPLTIATVLQRGEKLDDLVAKSDGLSMQSKAFYKQAKKQNSCWYVISYQPPPSAFRCRIVCRTEGGEAPRGLLGHSLVKLTQGSVLTSVAAWSCSGSAGQALRLSGLLNSISCLPLAWTG